ncbi:50S ribosomal protein L1 [Sharpea azabuensis]|jgi:large subunit ribosomal protein L1|uniref:Large ribosomal subunit protein uL1 n=1 Tax=Sharpea azabuensis TaxID=322505 RepID=A0A1H6UH81_9FIRM|nr:50S ribosomal protein L1 [Sharpea azabuensis]HAJ15366.1 50S ribosomal protein L1 [Erysipelotrichaceae bacterium]MDD6513637.1 50S ribosomal protein L1 [Sharpea azabuensis]MEE3307726.1 50S ribosomal protein L1 [Sharpea azabuensis]SEI87152.1 large subunit ribosomal protein L1 [Sharpea azabuensis]SFD67706.1 large subunit ribosomal protein L1 [Sharpea azabuensis]
MAKKGKKYLEAAKLIEKGKLYSAEEAVALVKKTATTKFDEGIDVVFNLNLDTRHADQQLRGAVVLPHGTGKSKTVWVLAEGAKAEEAKAAGADNVGAEEVLDAISKGELNFDVLIATPDQMAKLGRYGRVLGPKGLMPNPKTGTVTMDVAKAVEESKAGKVNYRTDKDGNVHVPMGRASFTDEQLLENYNTIHDLILRVKPSTAKGTYILNIAMSATMGPAVKVQA